MTREKNISYDQYKTTREAIKSLRDQSELRIDDFPTQGLVFRSIKQFADKNLTTLWHKALGTMPANIFNFIIRYLNNSLANNTNLRKWGVTNSSACPLCDKDQTLGHVLGGCQKALEDGRYNWRHDSVLLAISSFLKSLDGIQTYCDIESFLSPSILTGDTYRPDMAVVRDNVVYILELTVGFETNIQKNSSRKRMKYTDLLCDLSHKFKDVKFTNLSMGSAGIIGSDDFTLGTMLASLGLDTKETSYLIKKISSVVIRSSYYIFCKRNKEWEQPELLSW